MVKCSVVRCGNLAAVLANKLQCYSPHIAQLLALIVYLTKALCCLQYLLGLYGSQNSHYFSIQRELIGCYNQGGVYLLRGTN